MPRGSTEHTLRTNGGSGSAPASPRSGGGRYPFAWVPPLPARARAPHPAGGRAPMAGRFAVESQASQFRWRLKAGNGEMVPQESRTRPGRSRNRRDCREARRGWRQGRGRRLTCLDSAMSGSSTDESAVICNTPHQAPDAHWRHTRRRPRPRPRASPMRRNECEESHRLGTCRSGRRQD